MRAGEGGGGAFDSRESVGESVGLLVGFVVGVGVGVSVAVVRHIMHQTHQNNM